MAARPALVLLAAAGLLVPGPAGAAVPGELLAVDRQQVVHAGPPDGPLARVADGQTPAVSPDGSRLAFAAFPVGDSEVRSLHLWTARPDGSDLRQVTTGRADDAWPDWSPDGSTLVFLRDTPTGRVVATVPAGGGPVRTLAAGTGAPTWSPDGAFVAFGDAGGVSVVPADGRQVDALLPGTPESPLYEPDWSPDGTRLLVTEGGRDGTTSVQVVELAGGATRTVAVGALRDPVHSPAWSADGRTAYLARGYEPGTIARVDTMTGVLDPGFSTPGTGPALGGGAPERGRDSGAPGPVSGLTARALPSRAELTYDLPADRDRAGVVVRYAPGTTPPATAQDGLDGGRALLGRAVLRRLLPDTTYSVAVFARDWSGNLAPAVTTSVTTPHEVATTFRVSASRPLVVHGQTVDLGARLLREDTGEPVAGAVVQVLGHTTGQPDALIATASTDAAGLAVSRRRPTSTTRYTLRYDGDGQLLPGTGSPLVEVQAAVGVAARPQPVARGARAVVEVAVRPARPGALVTVTEVSATGRVLDTHRVRQGADGRLVTGVTTRTAGRHTVYVYVPDSPGVRGRTVPAPFVVR
ncbi:MAG: amidohydrolase [Frankiales bacterium]|nr:amidohydrolase [Frankiales bacterium]